MLARRFTIVCLITALFGIAFAIVVAEASRPNRSLGLPCIQAGFACSAAYRS